MHETHESSAAKPIPVLLVEDHAALRAGIRLLVEASTSFKVCGEASTAELALQQAAVLRPAVAIVDLSLGAGNGLDLLGVLRDVLPGLRILVLSMHSEQLYASPALQAGALGYLMKHEAKEHLGEALAAVAQGKIWLSAAMRATHAPEPGRG